MTDAPPKVGPIRLPEDFPVEWPEPGDEERLWAIDLMHAPLPIKPLTADLSAETTGYGINKGHEYYGRPIRMERRRINTYVFGNTRPVVPPPDIPEMMAAAEKQTDAALGTIWDEWEQSWLPELKENLRWFDENEISALTNSELIRLFNGWFVKLQRAYEIHFTLAPLNNIPGSKFQDFYTDLFGEDRALEAHELIIADTNMSLEVDVAIWQLAENIKTTQTLVDRYLAAAPGDEIASLDGSDGASQFDEFLNTYGHRTREFMDYSEPSWFEDPTPVADRVRSHLLNDDYDPRVSRDELIAQRDRRTDEIRSEIEAYPQPVLDQFEELLQRGRLGSRLKEDHAYWIDQNSEVRLRYLVIEIATRLTEAGVLETPDDVFYLELDELRESFSGWPGPDRHKLVAERKAEMDRWSGVAAPVEIGTRPPARAPAGATALAFERFFGPEVEQPADPDEIAGNPGSSGKVVGRARIVITLDEGGRVGKGEILVAPTTSPPWTSLFGVAAAVVTDGGGVLSHCAVVAREYGIPAVVGTRGATRQIPDGALIEVDGTAGRIRI
ncbi:MAG: hypothetical protein IH961_08645, partial [Chloroflexi bacterium]|nr:hypothetical protein [Chloroflexota bacterium]